MFLEQLKLKNVLSYRDLDFKFEPVTAIIGANAAGKSNLLHAIELLQGISTDLTRFRWGLAGPRTWAFGLPVRGGSIELDAKFLPIDDELAHTSFDVRIDTSEREYFIVEEHGAYVNEGKWQRVFDRKRQFGNILGEKVELSTSHSLLSRMGLAAPLIFVELQNRMADVRFYSDFDLRPGSALRTGVVIPAEKSRLSTLGDNLALIVNQRQHLNKFEAVDRYMKRLIPSYSRVSVSIEASYAALYLHIEDVEQPIPATRLSVGTLNFLALLVALFDPNPPPLICIEEPEKGLHPEAAALIARAILEASERTQIILTTHSKDLVDMFSSRPEYVVTAEYEPGEGTKLLRHTRDELDIWLDHFSLGDLWVRGEIGGNPQ